MMMVAFGVLVCCLCFYPGTLSLDSQWQLDQAYKNEYFDLHPPIMSYIWHWLNLFFPITQGSANLFLFSVVLYISAIILIAFAEQKSAISRWIFFCIILLFPPALLILGSVVKDTLMATSLLLAYAMLMHAEQKQSHTWLYFSLLPMFIGFSARHNSIFAVIPLCIWFAVIAYHIWNLATKIKYIYYAIIALVLISSLIVSKNLFSTHVIHAINSHASQYLIAYDLVGVSARTKENYLPAFYNKPYKPITDTFLNKIYRPYTNYYVFWPGNKGDSTLDCIWSDQDEKELFYAWFNATTKQPKAMLLHKMEIFFSLIGLINKHGQLAANQVTSPLGIQWANIIPDKVMDGWVYLLLFPIFFILSKKMTNSQKVLFWSGYLYALSWIISTPNSEQRYFSWVIISCTVLTASIMFPKAISFSKKIAARTQIG